MRAPSSWRFRTHCTNLLHNCGLENHIGIYINNYLIRVEFKDYEDFLILVITFVNFTYMYAHYIALQPHIPYWVAIVVCKMLKKLSPTITSTTKSWRHALDHSNIQPPTNPTQNQFTSSCPNIPCRMVLNAPFILGSTQVMSIDKRINKGTTTKMCGSIFGH